MSTKTGPLDFEATIDARTFNSMLDEMERRIKGTASAVVSEGDKIDDTFRNIAAGITAYFGANLIGDLTSQMTQIRGEFQQLEISFETMLKNKALADKLMADVVEFAAKTPFDLQQVATGAKQLLAYGTEVQNIIPTMRQLGDVASGLSIPFSDLVYLYGTSATQGKLMTKDLMQFAGRGIPIIDELSKILKVSKAEVMNLTERGKIGFSELQQVIENLTSSTGMFGGMMEKQAEAINGLRSNLGDAWDQMLNDIGQANEDTIEDTIKTTTSIVENYQRVLDILKVLVATYGVHRAAVILNTVAMAAYNTTMDWAIIKTKLLNLALKNNPGGLALSAITALIGGIWAYNRAMAATPSLVASINTETSKEIISLNSVFESLKNAKEGTDKRAEAIKIINDRYTKYLDNLLTEKSTIEDIEKAQKRATNALIADISVKQNKAKLEESLGEIASSFDSSFEGFLKVYSDTYGAERIGEFISSINEGVDKEIKARGGVIDRGVLEYSDFAKKVYDQFVSEISQQSGFLKYSFDEFQKSFLDFAQFKAGQLPFVSQMQATIASFQSMIDSFNPESGKKTTGGTPDDTKQTLAQKLKEIQQMYENYYRWVERYGKESADKQFSNLISGSASYLEYLERQIKKLESKPVKSTQDVNDLSTYLGAKDDLTGAKSRIELFEEEVEKAKEKYTDLVDYINFLKENLLAVGAFDGSEFSSERIKILYDRLTEAEKEFAKESLNTYQKAIESAANFSKKRTLIEQEYAAEKKKLDQVSLGEERYAEALAALQKIHDEKLNLVNSEEIKAGDAYKKIADELDKIGRVEAQRYISILEQQLEKLDKQSDAYKNIKGLIDQTKAALKSGVVDDLNQASNELRSMAEFASLFDEELGSIINNVSQIAGGLAAIASGNYFTGIMQVMTGIFSTIINASENAAQKAEEYRERVLERLSQRLSDINTLLERQIALIDKLSGSDKIQAFSDSFESLRREIVSVLNQIEQLEVSRKGYRGVTTLDLDSLIKTYREIYGNGRDVLINELDRDIIDRLLSENQQAIDQLYEEILNGDITGDKAEELKLLIEQLEANGESFEELKDKYNEYITGTTSDSIIDSIISGFEEGKFAAEDFADTFEELMKQAMLQAVKMKYLEGPLQQWYETFAAYSENGLTPEEIAALREAYNQIINSASAEVQNIQQITGSVAGLEDSLSGAVKGVSEETAGLIAGQMNAIRINQAHALALMDEQLAHLSEIASNTRYNRLLVDIKNLLQGGKNNSVNENRANGGQ